MATPLSRIESAAESQRAAAILSPRRTGQQGGAPQQVHPSPHGPERSLAVAARTNPVCGVQWATMNTLTSLAQRLGQAVNRERLLDTARRLVAAPSRTGEAGPAAD